MIHVHRPTYSPHRTPREATEAVAEVAQAEEEYEAGATPGVGWEMKKRRTCAYRVVRRLARMVSSQYSPRGITSSGSTSLSSAAAATRRERRPRCARRAGELVTGRATAHVEERLAMLAAL